MGILDAALRRMQSFRHMCRETNVQADNQCANVQADNQCANVQAENQCANVQADNQCINVQADNQCVTVQVSQRAQRYLSENNHSAVIPALLPHRCLLKNAYDKGRNQ